MATEKEWNEMIGRLQEFIDGEGFAGNVTITDEEYDFLISCLSEITDVIGRMSWDDLQDYLKEEE